MTPPETSTVRYSPSTTIGAWSIARCSSTARRASSRSSPTSRSSTANSSPPQRATQSSGLTAGAQAAGDLDEHAVAGAVPERVVDLLEVVEVEQHEPAVVPGLECERDVLAEREPVVRARDDVGARLLLGLHAQLAQLGVGAAQLVDARLQATLELTAVADVEHQAEPDVAAVAACRTGRCDRAPSARRRRSRPGGRKPRTASRSRALSAWRSLKSSLSSGVDQVSPLAARRVPVDRGPAREALAVGAAR